MKHAKYSSLNIVVDRSMQRSLLSNDNFVTGSQGCGPPCLNSKGPKVICAA